jgi:hypothetical protein
MECVKVESYVVEGGTEWCSGERGIAGRSPAVDANDRCSSQSKLAVGRGRGWQVGYSGVAVKLLFLICFYLSPYKHFMPIRL